MFYWHWILLRRWYNVLFWQEELSQGYGKVVTRFRHSAEKLSQTLIHCILSFDPKVALILWFLRYVIEKLPFQHKQWKLFFDFQLLLLRVVLLVLLLKRPKRNSQLTMLEKDFSTFRKLWWRQQFITPISPVCQYFLNHFRCWF